MRRLIVTLFLLMSSLGLAQTSLNINGKAVTGLNTTLVPDASYLPAQILADALGAQYSFDDEQKIATFAFAGRLITVQAVTGIAEAASTTQAVRVDGQPFATQGAALQTVDTIFVPLKALVEAMGGRISYLAEANTVVVVFPRAILTRVETTRFGASERMTLRFNQPATYELTYNRALNTLNLRFEQVDLADIPRRYSGTYFSSATLIPQTGYVDLRLTLSEDTSFEWFTAPAGSGFDLVIDVLTQAETQTSVAGKRIVIDPGHGGGDSGLNFSGYGTESQLVLELARQLQSQLEALGFEVLLTRDRDVAVTASSRSTAGLRADLFLSLHAANLPEGQYALYYLGDAASVPGLELAIRENAETASPDLTDAFRRQLLLELAPNLGAAPELAERFDRALTAAGTVQAQQRLAAPLYVLGGAAGRGLMLELSPADLSKPQLAELLTQSVLSLFDASTPP